jgi:enolase
MTTEVRFFAMKLALNILHKCLADASFGKGGEEIRKNLYAINRGLAHVKAFQDKKVLQALLHSQDTIMQLADKLAENDWEYFSLVMNLLGEVTAGNVLVVEKEQYDELLEQDQLDTNNVAQL